MNVTFSWNAAFAVVAGTMFMAISTHALASQDVGGHYVSYNKGKQTGKVEIEQVSSKQIRFEIYAEGPGGSSCSIGKFDKRFASLEGNVAIYKNADDVNAMAEGEKPGYELVFKFDKDKLALIETNKVEMTSQYCGMRANGSIGGTYVKKNLRAASVVLDDSFLKSTTGNSSVSLPVEQLIEDIKNIRLSDGKHPKIIGWQRKGNIYTFTFVADMRVELRFEHLLNLGGTRSSISAFANGTPTDPIALMMQIYAMPRDKTRFDIAAEKGELKRQKEEEEFEKQRQIKLAAEEKKQQERATIIKAARDEEDQEKDKIFIEKAKNATDNPNHFFENETYKKHFMTTLDKANMSDIQAMYELGMFYKENGENLLAAKWLFRAAVKRHSPSLFEAAQFSDSSDNFKEQLLQEAALLGSAKAQTRLSVKSLEKGDNAAYKKWLLEAAEKREIEALYLLGTNYIHGINGFDNNLKEGIRLLKLCIASEKAIDSDLLADENGKDKFGVPTEYRNYYYKGVITNAKSELDSILGR